MSDNVALILVAIVVGGGIVAVAAYYVARFMRGSIKLSLPHTAFNPGDTIAGSFDLHTKKTIKGNKLTVSLIGVQVTKTHEDGKRRTRSREVYRDEKLIEEAKEYAAGHTEKYDFELSAPNTNAPEFLDSPLGQTLSTALRLFSNRETYIKWRIEARLNAKGVDLAKSTRVSINMPNLP